MSDNNLVNQSYSFNPSQHSNNSPKLYSDYDSLVPFPSNMDFIEFCKVLINILNNMTPIKEINENKQIQLDILESIENLRKLRKFHPIMFENIMNCINLRFYEKLTFIKNQQIILNFLVLISEIYTDYEFKSKKTWIFDLLPFTIHTKCYFIDSEIHDLIDIIFNKITKSVAYSETFQTLIQVFYHCSDEEGEICLRLFKEIINNFSDKALSEFDFNYTMDELYDIQLSSDESRIEMLTDCLLSIKNKLDNNQFSELLNTLDEDNRILFLKILNFKGNVFNL